MREQAAFYSGNDSESLSGELNGAVLNVSPPFADKPAQPIVVRPWCHMLKFIHPGLQLVWIIASLWLVAMAFPAAAAPVGAEPADAVVLKSVECRSDARNESVSHKRTDLVHVGATGYGAPPPKYYPENQRRLMAMRASKIDAYRALAETINGLHIWGGTTIGDMVVQKDRYRVFMDAYVRGARILNVTANDDGNYETVIELMVDENFLAKAFAEPTRPPCGKEGAHVSFAPPESPSMFYYSE